MSNLNQRARLGIIKDMPLRIINYAKSFDKKLLASLKTHPFLLIPLFFSYGIIMVASGIFLALSMFFLMKVLGSIFPTQTVKTMMTMAFQMSFGLVSAILWLHYIYSALRTFVKSAAVVEKTSNVLKIVQLIAATAFAFSVIHYYVALFSDTPAYQGIEAPAPEGGWTENADGIDRLCFIPKYSTVIDFLYFSTVTMATVGYGDIHPKTPLAKLITMVQIVFAFELIVIGLGWAMGQKSDDPNNENLLN